MLWLFTCTRRLRLPISASTLTIHMLCYWSAMSKSLKSRFVRKRLVVDAHLQHRDGEAWKYDTVRIFWKARMSRWLAEMLSSTAGAQPRRSR